MPFCKVSKSVTIPNMRQIRFTVDFNGCSVHLCGKDVIVNPWKTLCSLDINARSELASEGINSQWNTMGLTGLTNLHPDRK